MNLTLPRLGKQGHAIPPIQDLAYQIERILEAAAFDGRLNAPKAKAASGETARNPTHATPDMKKGRPHDATAR